MVNTKVIFTIIAYLLLFAFLGIWMLIEYYDLSCPEGPYTKNKKEKCGSGLGKQYFENLVSESDTFEDSIHKISNASKVNNDEVIWRRFYISSFFAALLGGSLAMKRVLDGFELVTLFFVIFFCAFFTNNFFRYHHYRNIEKCIDDNLKHIEKKIKDSGNFKKDESPIIFLDQEKKNDDDENSKIIKTEEIKV